MYFGEYLGNQRDPHLQKLLRQQKNPSDIIDPDERFHEGKANDSFLVGYTANSKAYRVYNLSSKKVEETLNLRYLKDTPNVQGLGQEWYFDLDYLTDSLGYTRFKTNTPTGTQDTTINVSTQDDDSESKCDEHAILVPSFPSNSFSGPKVNDISAPIENNLDYAEELDRLQRQEHEAHFAATKYGFEFSNKTAEMLHQAEIGTHRNLVLAAGDPAGSIVSTGEVPAGSVPAGSVPSGSVTASHVPASSVPARSVPASNVPAGGVLAGSIDYAGFGNPAASESGFAIFTPDHAANSTLPPEEMQQFYNQQVWKPVPLPDGKIAIRTKWILKKKRDSRDKYVKDMLKKFDMESVRIATTPYEVPKPKSKDEADDAVNVYLYRSMTGSLMYLIASRPDIMFAMSAYSKHQVTPMTSHLNVVKKIFKYLKGQPNLGLWYPRDSPFQLKAYSDSDYARMIAVSCGFLLYAVQIIGRPPMLLVVPVFLLVVLVHADGWDSAGGCTIPTGSCTIPIALLYKDDHNKVAYLEKGKGWEAYEHILDFLNRSHIQYALTHHLPIVFDCLVKQFWATAIVHTLEAGPSEIIATIDGNEVVVTKSLIRTQLQLNDENRLYEFTIHDVLDGMREIWYPTDGSLTFYKAKLSPQWRFLIHTIIYRMSPKSGGVESVPYAAGAAVANEVLPPLPPPDGAPLVWEPTPSLVREPTPFREPTPDSPRPLSPPPYPRSEEVGPTSSTRPPSPTRQTSFQEDISEGGGNDVSLPKSNEAPPTAAATAAGGAEDSATLTDLSLKLDRCINRVTTLENELGVTKKVLGEEAATKEQDIDLDALHKLASTSLGGDTTVEAAYTIYKASRTRTKRRRLKKTYTSSDFEHFQENVSVVEDTIPAGDGIPDDAQTTPAGSTPISAGSSMNPSGQVDAAAPSSTIPAADKGKAPMVDDSLPVDLLTEKEREAEFARKQEELAQKAQAKSVASPAEQDWLELVAKIATNSALFKQLLGDDDNMNERLGMLLMRKRRELAELSRVKPMNETQQRDFMLDFIKNQSASVYNQGWTIKQVKALSIAQLKHKFEYIQWILERSNLLNFKRTTFRPTPTLEAPSAKRARQGIPQVVHATTSQVPASVSATPSIAADVSVPAASSIAANVSVSAVSAHVDTEVHANESRLDDTQTASERVSAEHTIDESTPSSSRNRRKQSAKKRVTPIVDVADDALIKFDSASESDDDPLPYAPYAGWEMVPTLLGFIHAYYDMEEHTKYFTSLRELLHMVEKNDLRKLLGAVDNIYQREEPDTFALILTAGVFAAGIYILVLRYFEPYAEAWVGSPKAARWRRFDHGQTVELASPEQMATGKDVSNPFMAVMVCQKPLGYFSSSKIHVPRAGLVIHPPGEDQMLLFHDPAVFGVPAGCSW
nr:hypothetical protein [Tanacetum cinerariifolium]